MIRTTGWDRIIPVPPSFCFFAPPYWDEAYSFRPAQPALLGLRRGIPDGVRYAWSLLRRVHPGHLHPWDQRRLVPDGTDYGECTLRQSLSLSRGFRPFPLKLPVWVMGWGKKDAKNHKSILAPQMEIEARFSTSSGVSGRRTRRIHPSSVGSVPPLHPLPDVPPVMGMAVPSLV